MLGNKVRILRILPDIPGNRVVVREVHRIRLLGVRIPLRGEDAMAADALEPHPEPANAREQINKPEGAPGLCRRKPMRRSPIAWCSVRIARRLGAHSPFSYR